jgi:ElaB/YqjD/DUF883 family membrane-anchored ribosome-binding protein
MADETSTTPTETEAPAEAPDTTPNDLLGDAGKAALSAERKARRDAEKQLREATERLAAFEDATKTETQKASDRATASEVAAQQWRDRYEAMVKRNHVTEAAVAAKALDPATVYALLRDDIELDDDGTPTNVDKLVANLAKSKPFLFGSPAAGARDAQPGQTFALNDGDALSNALLGAVGARR